ncbi:hypothetical protein N8I77_002889 [Diaporthe amygdali]|uniref:BTB domain-containing protein n=1 Tax=Phomopsis amygdali TaxID=1214568 RepID=A0AAD9SHS1_PHOAM|nr:hypothetical protein N8I77_002889 [Diaporthe amygdali]
MSVNNGDDQEATPAKRQKLGDGRFGFRSNDMELLRTGSFSDAQVIAGNRVWKVHKSIVCLRSGFMHQVLAGPFKQGQAAIVRIDVCTEKQLDLVLEFIYSRSIEATEHLSLADCVELSMLGNVLLSKN